MDTAALNFPKRECLPIYCIMGWFMKLFYILALVVLLFSPSSFSQWSWQSNLPQGNYLCAVAYIDSNICMAVGYAGTIIRTTDGGVTWQRQHSGTIATFYSVAFANASTGIVVGDSGIVLTTTNGGLVWTRQNSQTSVSLRAAAFQDPVTITVVGSSGLIIKSSDGGNVWMLRNSGTSNGLMCVSFLNKSEGVIGGYKGTLLKTLDGGETWNILPPQDDIHDYHTISLQDSSIIYTGSNMSSDGGMTWVKYDNPGFFGLSFANKSHAVGVSVNGQIFRTTDSGLTWCRSVPDSTLSFQGVSFSDSLHGMIIGSYGVIFKTSDGGISWNQISRLLITGGLQSVSFANKDNGIAVGGGGILKTSDGGIHWEKMNESPNFLLTGIYLINNLKAVGFATNGQIFLTKDGGNSWAQIIVGSFLYSITFSDANNGIIVGDTVLKTSDGGETWFGRNRGVKNRLYSVQFPSQQIGYAVGGYGTIVKTTDGGDTWVSIGAIDYYNFYYACSFTDEDNGTIVGSYGTILHTTDGGITWNKQFSSGSPNITYCGISLVDNLNGTIIGLNGTILHTTDGGNNWLQCESVTRNTLRGICFTDSNNGTVIGEEGTLLHTTNGGISFINVSPTSSRSVNFELFQNYPNPFNPETTIDYQLPHTGLVILKIYDILGREIKTLINETQIAGKHSVSFTAGQLSNGVYFYQLSLDGFRNVKKMLLLK